MSQNHQSNDAAESSALGAKCERIFKECYSGQRPDLTELWECHARRKAERALTNPDWPNEVEIWVNSTFERMLEQREDRALELLIMAKFHELRRIPEELEFEGSTLHDLVHVECVSAVRALLEAGVNVNAKDGTEATPLHDAATIGHTAIAALLLDYGANVNAKDAVGWTPLHHAADFRRAAMVQKLVASGAQVNAPDHNGHTPRYVAWQNEDPETERIFADCGGIR